MGRILIKLGENVGTLVRLIVLKFEHSAVRGKPFRLCVSELFESIETHFFFNFEHSAAKGNNYAAPDCDSSDSDLIRSEIIGNTNTKIENNTRPSYDIGSSNNRLLFKPTP